MVASLELRARIESVRERIETACDRSGRPRGAVRLVGVTKTVPAAVVREAVEAGLGDLGENYLRELEDKRAAAPGARWHFIGRLQRNKVSRVAELADLIQTVEPGRAAARLAAIGRERGTPVPCLVEVDLTGDRVGVEQAEAPGFVELMNERGGLAVRGLMAVAPLGEEPRAAFALVRELRDRLRASFPEVTELSMGMSADLDEAVEEGATMVRIGSAIFGPRP